MSPTRDFGHIIDSLAGITWEADPTTYRFTFVSKQAEEMLGYPVERWTAEPGFWNSIVHPEDRGRIFSTLAEIIEQRSSLQADYRMITAGGDTLWVRDIISAEYEGDTPLRLYGFLTTIPQVTPRHDSLLEKEEQYRRIFEVTSDGLLISDLEGNVVEVNPAFAAMHGYTQEEMVGMNVRDFAHPERYNHLGEFFGTVEEGNQVQIQSRNIRKDGSIFPVDVHGVPFLYNGKPQSLAIIRDITEQVQSYELLESRVADRTNELSTLLEVASNMASSLELEPLLTRVLSQLRTVVEYSRASITVADRSDINWDSDPALIEEVNSITFSLWGDPASRQPLPRHSIILLDDYLEVGENMRRGLPTIIPDIHEAQPALRELIKATTQDNDPDTRERLWQEERCLMFVPLSQKGTTVGGIILRHPQPAYYNERHANLALGIAHQAAVAIENGRLLVQAHEKAALEERQRLARELHDSVTQSLFSINLIARSVEMMIQREGNHSPETLEKMVDLRQLTQGALAEMRALIFELRPGALEEEGLLQAIRKHAAAVEGREQIRVDVIADEKRIPRLKHALEEALYRIAQESLHNIVKHSKATRVEITLKVLEDNTILLQVTDNGIGFDRSEVPAGHMGLGTMGQRAAALGGHAGITSAPGKGTTVAARIPIVNEPLITTRS